MNQRGEVLIEMRRYICKDALIAFPVLVRHGKNEISCHTKEEVLLVLVGVTLLVDAPAIQRWLLECWVLQYLSGD